MWRILLVRLLLGRKPGYYEFMKVKGRMYVVAIQPYVSAEDVFRAAVNSGVFTADNPKTEYD